MSIGVRKIAVIGAGPVGAILSAHLSSAGHAVILVDAWKEHMDRIRSDGLHIVGREDLRTRPAQLLDSVGELGNSVPEFIFICTKACDIDSVLGEMSDTIKRSNVVFISFQNGIDTELAVVEHIEKHRVLRGVVSYAGVLVAPGKIRESFFIPPNHLGWLDERGAESCREAAALISASGLTTEATDQIGRYVWRKAILNSCTMAIAAITGMNMRELMEFPPTARLVDLLLNESVAIAEAYGFHYGPGFLESVREFNNKAGPHKPSMLIDIENGRRTENSFLIRRIAERAEEKGVPAPYHRMVANLIDALEKRALERH